jgi:hypothetical protein
MGYLTIKSYDPVTRFYQVKYPNEEVKTALHIHLMATLTKTSLGTMNSIMEQLFSSLLKEDLEKAIQCIRNIFNNIPYQLYKEERTGKKEHFYHAIVQALFIASGIKSQAEYSTSLERADLIIDLPKLLYIIEIKTDVPPEEGLKQIETKKYYEPFLHLGKPILAVGISFHRKKARDKKKEQFSITYAAKKL